VLEFPLNPADGVEPGSPAPRSESLVPPLSSSLGGPLSRLGLDKGASPGFVGAKVSPVFDVPSCARTIGEAVSAIAGICDNSPASTRGSAAAVNIDFMKASLSR